jgi:hypothetical protein
MRGWMLWTAVAVVLAAAGSSRAENAVQLDRAGLQKQAAQNKALARYLKYNGYPDVADVRPIIDQPPWDDHEVTLYYLGSRKEISFARARILGRPEVASTRYERVMTDADVRALKNRGGELASTSGAGSQVSGCTGSATERAECAAGRAESAADRVDAAAKRAETAADKTEAIVAKMEARGGSRRRVN